MLTNPEGLNDDPDEGFEAFVALQGGALQSSGVPQVYWRSLYHKITNEVYDAGEVFGIIQLQQEEDGENGERKKGNYGVVIGCKVVVTRESGLEVSDPTSIFLVDHAWTYRVEHARQQLEQIPGLLPRMASLMGVDFHGEDPPPDVVELILERMWKYNQTYQLSQGASLRTASHYISLSVSMCFSPLLCCVCVWVCVCVQSAEEKVPVWYIMDEFGSQVQHLDHPSCCMAPFFYMQGQLAYTLLWPLQDLQEGAGDRDKTETNCGRVRDETETIKKYYNTALRNCLIF
ncbi:tubulin--tyrosine ligase-like protein 12 isoform X2 [Xiphophorus hellerii]|uniref:tubulin--tyrosine ligase-like protein 12 isoform X2 n=1 Tax=Xiphophorus hellerii TaxID=8084 RepID=UPI0013B3C70A|nr:tubulin--tyrosine ligase-like protein 12 isoform X2 [Xiphophorus hellerii]